MKFKNYEEANESGFFSKTQLKKMSLQPSSESTPVRVGTRYIHDGWPISEAVKVPKREVTEAQMKALEKAKDAAEFYRMHGKIIAGKPPESIIDTLKKEAVFLDVDTTDLEGDVIRISITDGSGRALINQLVTSDEKISPDAFYVNKIEQDDLIGKPTLKSVMKSVEDICKNKIVFVYFKEWVLDVFPELDDLAEVVCIKRMTECSLELKVNAGFGKYEICGLYEPLSFYMRLSIDEFKGHPDKSLNDCLIMEVIHKTLCSVFIKNEKLKQRY